MQNIQHQSHSKAKHHERAWRNLLEIATRFGELIVPHLEFLSNKLKLIPSSSTHGLAVAVARRRSGRHE